MWLFQANCTVSEYSPEFPVFSGTNESSVSGDHFHLLYGKDCPKINQHYRLNPRYEAEKYYLQEDGSLFVPSEDLYIPVQEYCMDMFVDEEIGMNNSVLICYDAPENNNDFYYIGKYLHIHVALRM